MASLASTSPDDTHGTLTMHQANNVHPLDCQWEANWQVRCFSGPVIDIYTGFNFCAVYGDEQQLFLDIRPIAFCIPEQYFTSWMAFLKSDAWQVRSWLSVFTGLEPGFIFNDEEAEWLIVQMQRNLIFLDNSSYCPPKQDWNGCNTVDVSTYSLSTRYDFGKGKYFWFAHHYELRDGHTGATFVVCEQASLVLVSDLKAWYRNKVETSILGPLHLIYGGRVWEDNEELVHLNLTKGSVIVIWHSLKRVCGIKEAPESEQLRLAVKTPTCIIPEFSTDIGTTVGTFLEKLSFACGISAIDLRFLFSGKQQRPDALIGSIGCVTGDKVDATLRLRGGAPPGVENTIFPDTRNIDLELYIRRWLQIRNLHCLEIHAPILAKQGINPHLFQYYDDEVLANLLTRLNEKCKELGMSAMRVSKLNTTALFTTDSMLFAHHRLRLYYAMKVPLSQAELQVISGVQTRHNEIEILSLPSDMEVEPRSSEALEQTAGHLAIENRRRSRRSNEIFVALKASDRGRLEGETRDQLIARRGLEILRALTQDQSATYRQLQRDVLISLVNGSNTMIRMPTGSGKSANIALAGAMAHGPCIVVTPLTSLNKQLQQELARISLQLVRNLGDPCPYAATSAFYSGGHQELRELALNGRVKFVTCAPEVAEKVVDAIRENGVNIGLIAIDEVHCAALWSEFRMYDFCRSIFERRTSCNRIGLLNTLFLLQSATISNRTCEEISRILGMTSNRPVFIKGPALAPNVVINKVELTKKFNWTCALDMEIANLPQDGTAIFYFSTIGHENRSWRSATAANVGVRDAARYLEERHPQNTFLQYYGSNGDLRKAEIRRREEMRNKTLEHFFNHGTASFTAIVATVAFGMGMSRDDVRRVAVFGWPLTCDDVVQKLGRCGRDGRIGFGTVYFSRSAHNAVLAFRHREHDRAAEFMHREGLFADLWTVQHGCPKQTLIKMIDGGESPGECGRCAVCAEASNSSSTPLEDYTESAMLLFMAVEAIGQHRVTWCTPSKLERTLRGKKQIPEELKSIECWGRGKERTSAYWCDLLLALGMHASGFLCFRPAATNGHGFKRCYRIVSLSRRGSDKLMEFKEGNLSERIMLRPFRGMGGVSAPANTIVDLTADNVISCSPRRRSTKRSVPKPSPKRQQAQPKRACSPVFDGENRPFRGITNGRPLATQAGEKDTSKSYNGTNGRWKVMLKYKHNGGYKSFGRKDCAHVSTFDCIVEAAIAHDKAALEMFNLGLLDKRPTLNFPDANTESEYEAILRSDSEKYESWSRSPAYARVSAVHVSSQIEDEKQANEIENENQQAIQAAAVGNDEPNDLLFDDLSLGALDGDWWDGDNVSVESNLDQQTAVNFDALPSGFVNHAGQNMESCLNKCYIIVALQVLCHVPAIRLRVLQAWNACKENQNAADSRVLEALACVMTEYDSKSASDFSISVSKVDSILRPQLLQNGVMGNESNGGYADSMEVFMFLLDALRDEWDPNAYGEFPFDLCYIQTRGPCSICQQIEKKSLQFEMHAHPTINADELVAQLRNDAGSFFGAMRLLLTKDTSKLCRQCDQHGIPENSVTIAFDGLPVIYAVPIIWKQFANASENERVERREDIEQLVRSVLGTAATADLRELDTSLDEANSIFELQALVLFGGSHYTVFLRDELSGSFALADDENVSGPFDPDQVIEKCTAGLQNIVGIIWRRCTGTNTLAETDVATAKLTAMLPSLASASSPPEYAPDLSLHTSHTAVSPESSSRLSGPATPGSGRASESVTSIFEGVSGLRILGQKDFLNDPLPNCKYGFPRGNPNAFYIGGYVRGEIQSYERGTSKGRRKVKSARCMGVLHCGSCKSDFPPRTRRGMNFGLASESDCPKCASKTIQYIPCEVKFEWSRAIGDESAHPEIILVISGGAHTHPMPKSIAAPPSIVKQIGRRMVEQSEAPLMTSYARVEQAQGFSNLDQRGKDTLRNLTELRKYRDKAMREMYPHGLGLEGLEWAQRTFPCGYIRSTSITCVLCMTDFQIGLAKAVGTDDQLMERVVFGDATFETCDQGWYTSNICGYNIAIGRSVILCTAFISRLDADTYCEMYLAFFKVVPTALTRQVLYTNHASPPNESRITTELALTALLSVCRRVAGSAIEFDLQWQQANVDFSDAERVGFGRAIGLSVLERIDYNAFCAMEPTVRKERAEKIGTDIVKRKLHGCRFHFLQSVTKHANRLALGRRQEFKQAARALLAIRHHGNAESWKIAVDLIHNSFPVLRGWLNWWTRDVHGQMIFPGQMSTELYEALNSSPSEKRHDTNCIAEIMHRTQRRIMAQRHLKLVLAVKQTLDFTLGQQADFEAEGRGMPTRAGKGVDTKRFRRRVRVNRDGGKPPATKARKHKQRPEDRARECTQSSPNANDIADQAETALSTPLPAQEQSSPSNALSVNPLALERVGQLVRSVEIFEGASTFKVLGYDNDFPELEGEFYFNLYDFDAFGIVTPPEREWIQISEGDLLECDLLPSNYVKISPTKASREELRKLCESTLKIYCKRLPGINARGNSELLVSKICNVREATASIEEDDSQLAAGDWVKILDETEGWWLGWVVTLIVSRAIRGAGREMLVNALHFKPNDSREEYISGDIFSVPLTSCSFIEPRHVQILQTHPDGVQPMKVRTSALGDSENTVLL